MTMTPSTAERPAIHVLVEESDLIGSLAPSVEQRQPVVAAMLLEEIERANLHAPGTLPADTVTLGAQVCFVDERSGVERDVQLVLPADADIGSGRVSILTPIGAALYGLSAGDAIDWPDLDGNARRIRIKRVSQPRTPSLN